MRTLILRRAIGEHSILTSAKTEGLVIVRDGPLVILEEAQWQRLGTHEPTAWTSGGFFLFVILFLCLLFFGP